MSAHRVLIRKLAGDSRDMDLAGEYRTPKSGTVMGSDWHCVTILDNGDGTSHSCGETELKKSGL